MNKWKKHRVTRNWDNVKSFWSYWTGWSRRHGHFTTSSPAVVRRYVHEGDVTQFYDRRGGWFHTVVVHYKTRYNVYYTSHVADYVHKGLRHANFGRYGRKRITKYRVIHMGF